MAYRLYEPENVDAEMIQFRNQALKMKATIKLILIFFQQDPKDIIILKSQIDTEVAIKRKFITKHLETVKTDVELLNPMTVQKNPMLKAKSPVPKSARKRLIHSFTDLKNRYFKQSPMVPIYNLFQQRYFITTYFYRDRYHQQTFFQKDSQHHLSKAIQYTVQQVLSNLTFEDTFKVKLDRSDFDKYLSRQPRKLQQSLDVQDLMNMQNKDVERDLNSNRKIQLIQNVFNNPHFNAKDREVLYQVLIHQINHAIKQGEKLEKASLNIRALGRFQNKREGYFS
ncbi:hypothetical protein pb186bvf_011291 [Paramecium bursaria]